MPDSLDGWELELELLKSSASDKELGPTAKI
jgi:hypothetical protein